MEVHRQKCQSCQSIDLRNIIVRDQNQPMTIYCRCAHCGKLVARYQLSNYYHHGKGLESYLRSQGVNAADSARRWLREFQGVQQQSEQGYEAALQVLRDAGKRV